LPQTYEFGDLYNEGWIVYEKCLRSFDPNSGTKFSTFFWKGLNDRFYTIARAEWLRHKGRDNSVETECASSTDAPQDRQTMVKQFVDAVCLISPGFADLVANGVPEELFRFCRRSTRCYRKKRGWDVLCGEFRLNAGMVEKFFRVPIRKLRPVYYNSVE